MEICPKCKSKLDWIEFEQLECLNYGWNDKNKIHIM